MNNIGIVIIGRNEGERLRQCFESIAPFAQQTVYVDSGSTDGSVELARSRSIAVVELDGRQSFTAARARNAGLFGLLERHPGLEFVQFVDGDCQIVAEWLDRASHALKEQSDVAVVAGRRRERYPERSIYNQLCDWEWDTPVGEAKACGGDAMMRVTAFQQAGGFNPHLIAGEEPELCVRLRQNGWRILRLEAEMTLHDANMMRLGQWWKRMLRSGYAYAEGAWLHGNSAERHWVKESRSIWLWGGLLPLIAIASLPATHGFSGLLLLIYPVQIYRIHHRFVRGATVQGKTRLQQKNAIAYALSCVLGKFPQLQGQIQFHQNRLLKQRRSLVEYK